MQKAQAALEKLEAKREAAQLERLLAATDAIGLFAGTATEDDRGFVLTGGQFVRAESVGQVVENVLKAVVNDGEPALPPAEQEQLDKAWERYSETQRQWTDARLEDAERAQGKATVKLIGKGGGKGGGKAEGKPATKADPPPSTPAPR
jgi:hypothetical protein